MNDKPIQVLLVEDNPGDARLLRELLRARKWSFELTWVDNLEQGLTCLSEVSIDVVLLDLALTESRGLPTFVRVYQHAPHVPIIVMTGLDDEDLAMQAVRQGAQDYLIKGQASPLLLMRAIQYAIERKQAQEALHRHAEEQAVLYAVTAAAATSLDPEQLFATILEVVLPLFKADAGWVALQGMDRQNSLDIVARWGIPAKFSLKEWEASTANCPAHGPSTPATETKSALVVDCPLLPAARLQDLGLQSHACIPLTASEEKLGVLTLAWGQAPADLRVEATLLLTIGRQVGLALHNAQLYQQARQMDRLQVLNELDQALTATLDPSVVAEVTLRRIAAALDAPQGILIPHDLQHIGATRRILTLRDGWQDQDTVEKHPLWASFWPWLHLAATADRKAEIALEDNRGSRALVVPIQNDEGLAADLILTGRPAERPFTDEDLALAQAAAGRAGQAIRNAHLYDAVRLLLREREETQAQLIHSAKISALGRMTASIAHEISNPIQSVLSCLDLVTEEMEGPIDRANRAKLTRYLQIAESEIERIGGIVRRMRNFYRPAAKGVAMTDVHAVLEDVLALTGKELHHAHVSVERQWLDGLPRIEANADQLKQVFLNLVLNAADAMPQGGTLALCTALDRVHPRSGDDLLPAVRIDFRDSGTGIPDPLRERLFEPFLTTKSEGSGLGLYISHEIVETHRGEILVDSVEGQGATFSILLPVKQPAG